MSMQDTKILDWIEQEKPKFTFNTDAPLVIMETASGKKIGGPTVRECVMNETGISFEKDLENEVLKMIVTDRNGSIVPAIKHVRNVTGMSLKEAKDYVDRIQAGGVTPNAPIKPISSDIIEMDISIPAVADSNERSYRW